MDDKYLKYIYQHPLRFGHKDCSYYQNEMDYGQLHLRYHVQQLNGIELQILNRDNPHEADINISSSTNGMCQIPGSTRIKGKHVPYA